MEDRTMTKSEALQQTAFTWTKQGDEWRRVGGYKEAATAIIGAVCALILCVIGWALLRSAGG
jgi:hypothetical protein